MFNSVRKWSLGSRAAIYTLAMTLFGGCITGVFYFFCLPHDKDPFATAQETMLLPWLVCYGAGLASLVLVEPFRRPGGSPYGFLLGGAVRTTPPLVLVILFLVTQQPVARPFWFCLLAFYFLMLLFVILLTIPASGACVCTEGKSESKKNKEKKGTSNTC